MDRNVYKDLKARFADDDLLTVNDGKGAQGIKFGKKMIVMFYKGDLTVQLAPERVAELIACGVGLPHDPGTGKPMKDRVLVPASKADSWIGLVEEARDWALRR